MISLQLQASSGKVSPLTLDPGGRRSPATDLDDKPRTVLSCLSSYAVDEDREPVSKSSPDKKPIISPSGRSISDIFGKVESVISQLVNMI